MANGVDNSFGLTLFGKVKDLLAANCIFEEHRASGTNFQRDGSVDRHTQLPRLGLAPRVTPEAGELILL